MWPHPNQTQTLPGVSLPQAKPVPRWMLMMKMCLAVTCLAQKRALPRHKMSWSALLIPWLWGQKPSRQWCRGEANRHQGSKVRSKISWVSFLPPTSSPIRWCSRPKEQAGIKGCQGCAGAEEMGWDMEEADKTSSWLPQISFFWCTLGFHLGGENEEEWSVESHL